MNPQPKEIYIVQTIYRLCTDKRPCVVIEILKSGYVKFARISSAMDLYHLGRDFLIENNHPNFQDTGLKRTSYVSGEDFIEVPLSDVSKKTMGKLTGDLAKAFDKWLG
ncbi:MAG: hypothetical protein HUU50_17560 [Candidatus Brocadiae bacterium]|nr:hypothetical protein [Candidatus Brocadiia bacterium]